MAGEWINSAEFRAGVRLKTREYSLSTMSVEPEVVALLEGLLDRRAARNIIEESARPALQQRSRAEAMISLQLLLDEARSIAVEARRPTIQAADVALAYARKFCQFFPFC